MASALKTSLRIKSLVNFDTFENPSAGFEEVSRLTILSREMKKKTEVKRAFSQINDKRFYFPDGILFLPF